MHSKKSNFVPLNSRPICSRHCVRSEQWLSILICYANKSLFCLAYLWLFNNFLRFFSYTKCECELAKELEQNTKRPSSSSARITKLQIICRFSLLFTFTAPPYFVFRHAVCSRDEKQMRYNVRTVFYPSLSSLFFIRSSPVLTLEFALPTEELRFDFFHKYSIWYLQSTHKRTHTCIHFVHNHTRIDEEKNVIDFIRLFVLAIAYLTQI